MGPARPARTWGTSTTTRASPVRPAVSVCVCVCVCVEGWGAQGEEQEDRGREETEEHPSRRHVARVPAWSCGKARQRPLEEGFVLLAQGPSKYQTLPGAHSGVAERSLITSEVSEEWGGERWDSPLSALLSFISPTVGTSQPKGDSAVTPV